MEALETKINEIPQIAFFNNLENEVSNLNDIKPYTEGCSRCYDYDKTEKFVRTLVYHYDKYKNYLNNDSYIKYCSYFKSWLYRKRMLIFPREYALRDYWDSCILCVWDNLEKKNGVPNRTCKFDNKDFPYSFVHINNMLNEVCSIRSETKLLQAIRSDRQMCLNFNIKLNTYLKEMLNQIGTISSESKLKQSYFNLYDQCALKNVKTLFTEIECPSDDTANVQKQETCLTPEATTPKACTEQTCNNLDQLCEQTCKEKVCNTVECPIKNDCTPTSCDSLEQLYPELCSKPPPNLAPTSDEPEKSPYKIPHLQVPVTVLSSVVGTIFFFLFLYKFTPFRAWFLNRIGSKNTLKHKIKQDMEREFLGSPFQPPYRDDQNSRPRVGYSQN